MALTSQLLGALLQVDGRANEGGVLDIPPGARLLLDVLVEGTEDGALLEDIAAAVVEAKAARDQAELISGLTGEDAAVRALIDNPASEVSEGLSATYARGRSVTAYGAVADYNGTTGTDNLAAFNAAKAAAKLGEVVFVPAGRYYFSDKFVIDKMIHLDCGAAGIQQNGTGTELVFAAGKTGLHVKENGSGVVPHGARIGPFQITSKSTAAGSDVGILCTNGRVTIDDTAVSGFGSHGYHLKAGAESGGGNVNLSILNTPRAYGNRGDGIKIEGSDSNHCTVIRPDLTANYGWGLNFHYSSHAYVLAPHIDHQYHSSPGAIRDYGDSNTVEHVYLETGDGSTNGGKIQLYRNVGAGDESRFFRATFGYYGGGFTLEDQTTALPKSHVIDSASRGRIGAHRMANADESHAYRIDVGGINAASMATVHTPEGGSDRVVTEFFPAYDHYWIGAHAVPRAHNAWDLGEASQRWRDVIAQRYIRLGSLYLRDNAGVLEKSTDGSTWSAV